METKKKNSFFSNPMSKEEYSYIIIFPEGFLKAKLSRKAKLLKHKPNSVL